MSKEWLENLQVGDEVVFLASDKDCLTKVTRLTKTCIFLNWGKGEMKVRRKDGHAPGQWNVGSITAPTPELIDHIRHRNLVDYLIRQTMSDWDVLSLEDLRRIVGFIIVGRSSRLEIGYTSLNLETKNERERMAKKLAGRRRAYHA